jgi:hypothetical protein
MMVEPQSSSARRVLRALLAVAMALGAVALLVSTVLRSSGEFEAEAVETPSGVARGSGDAALLAAPDSGVVYFAWVEGDSSGRRVQFARSNDGGASWSQPVTVSDGPDDVGPPHGEASPRLVAGEAGQVALVWSRNVSVPGRKWPASMIRFARSVNAGTSWSAPRTLNDDSTSAPGTHTFHGVSWSERAGLVAAWLDERGGEGFPGHHHTVGDPTAAVSMESDARIFMTSSADFGASWSANQAVWGGVCPCCRVALAPEPDGGMVAAWRQHFPGDVRDIVVAPLAPGAMAPERVHEDNWEYPGCPHTGPALAIARDGVRHVVWYTGKPGGAGVYYVRADSAGRATGEPVGLVTGVSVQTAHATVQPLSDGGALVALDVDEKGSRAIRLVRIDARGRIAEAETLEGSAGGKYPQVAVNGDSALVAWTGSAAGGSAVRMVRLEVEG